MTRVALIITTFNRPALLRECLDSVKRTSIVPEDVIIVDDDSGNEETKKVIRESGYHTIWKISRAGIKNSLLAGYTYLFGKGYDLVINLDADAVLRNDAIEVLVGLKKRFPDNIVSGFNTTVKNRNPIIDIYSDHFLKKYASGICLCINKQDYEKYILPALNKPVGNWDFDASLLHGKDNKAVVVARPSIVQHIGIHESAMGHITSTEPPDIAEDFTELYLPDVKLIGATGDEVKKAFDISTKHIQFGGYKILPSLSSKAEYNKFMLKELSEHFETSHCLVIQPDGYVINWKAWSNDFLNYDYIGARWHFNHPEYPGYNVGNGGFSLRSKRLCDILKEDEKIIPLNDRYIRNFEEDHNISKLCRNYLEETYCIKFAPPEVADRFSIEVYGVWPPGNKYKGSFGFHGFGNIDFRGAQIEHIPQKQAKQFAR